VEPLRPELRRLARVGDVIGLHGGAACKRDPSAYPTDLVQFLPSRDRLTLARLVSPTVPQWLASSIGVGAGLDPNYTPSNRPASPLFEIFPTITGRGG
jgi:hypothetical protein